MTTLTKELIIILTILKKMEARLKILEGKHVTNDLGENQLPPTPCTDSSCTQIYIGNSPDYSTPVEVKIEFLVIEVFGNKIITGLLFVNADPTYPSKKFYIGNLDKCEFNQCTQNWGMDKYREDWADKKLGYGSLIPQDLANDDFWKKIGGANPTQIAIRNFEGVSYTKLSGYIGPLKLFIGGNEATGRYLNGINGEFKTPDPWNNEKNTSGYAFGLTGSPQIKKCLNQQGDEFSYPFEGGSGGIMSIWRFQIDSLLPQQPTTLDDLKSGDTGTIQFKNAYNLFSGPADKPQGNSYDTSWQTLYLKNYKVSNSFPYRKGCPKPPNPPCCGCKYVNPQGKLEGYIFTSVIDPENKPLTPSQLRFVQK